MSRLASGFGSIGECAVTPGAGLGESADLVAGFVVTLVLGRRLRSIAALRGACVEPYPVFSGPDGPSRPPWPGCRRRRNRRHVTGDDRARGHDAAVSDIDPGKDHRAQADMAAFADPCFERLKMGGIMGPKCRRGPTRSVKPRYGRRGGCLVEVGLGEIRHPGPISMPRTERSRAARRRPSASSRPNLIPIRTAAITSSVLPGGWLALRRSHHIALCSNIQNTTLE